MASHVKGTKRPQGLGLNVDEQEDRWAVGVDTSTVFLDAFAQRVKIERLKRALWVYVVVVCYEKLISDEVNIDFDATESPV